MCIETVFGLYMCAGKRGMYYLNPVSEGPAERAGVQPGDILVWINGVMVSTLTHSALAKMVSWHCRFVTCFSHESVSVLTLCFVALRLRGVVNS